MTVKILIVGTGLIGGSIGLALKRTVKAEGATTVIGYDASRATAEAACAGGAIDAVATDLASGSADADLIVVATPVGEVLPTVEQIASTARPGVVVTDVGSTKAAIVSTAEALLGPGRSFVGGHPMAGTEGEGIDSARADLFEGALWILAPTKATDPDAYREVNSLVGRLGANVLALDPIEHDRLVALVSHLPYAIATALMVVAAGEDDARLFRAAAGSFRDVTRSAGSNPRIWRDIFATNRDAVVRELDQFVNALSTLRSAVRDGRWDDFDALVATARDARRRLPAKGERAPVDPVVVEVGIPDRAGVLAEVTTAVGEAGINIEDLWVDHTPGGGVLRLLVDGHQLAQRTAELLAGKDFRTTIVEER